MPETISREHFAEAGRKGARKRWGPVRHVRLADLPPEKAAAIRALLELEDAADAAAKDRRDAA